MQPIDPGEQYGAARVYAANQPEYNPLVSRIDAEGATFTLWELSEDERRAILDGARIGLRMQTFGGPLQPVYLAVEGTVDWPYDHQPNDLPQALVGNDAIERPM